MLPWADAMDYAFRALAAINIFLLVLLFVMENKAREREKLVQHKLDLIGARMGLKEEFALLDHQHGRETGLAPMDFPDSTPG